MDAVNPHPGALEPGEILGSAFRLYRENALLFLGVLAILLIPQAILDLISPSFTYLSILTGAFSTGALLTAIGARYSGRSVTPMEAYSTLGIGLGLTFLVVQILYGLMVVVGLILLIVPGVYLAVRYAFWGVDLVLRRGDIGSSFSRSAELVEGNWWRVFGIGLLVILAVIVVGIVVSIALGPALGQRASSAISVVINILLNPFVYSSLVIMYFDLRLRNEGPTAVSGTTTGPLTGVPS